MAPIAAALGLFGGPNLTTYTNAHLNPHNWIFSQIAPFQGKIVFEKLSCGVPSASFVRIRANGAILSGWCDGWKRMGQMLCIIVDRLRRNATYSRATSEMRTKRGACHIASDEGRATPCVRHVHQYYEPNWPRRERRGGVD